MQTTISSGGAWRTLRNALLLFAALSLFATACGDDDDSDSGSASESESSSESESGSEEANSTPGEGVTATVARGNYNTNYMQAEVYRALLQELGFDVPSTEENELAPDLGFTALGQGDVDIWADGWFPLHQEFYDAAQPEAVQAGLMAPAGGFQGYLIDKATADEYGITSIEQIEADPELAALFDIDGNGLADLVGCNAGWGCYEAIETQIADQGFSNIEHLSAEYFVLFAEMLARFDRGEPVLYYTWMPNWTVGRLVPGEDVVWLNSPTHPNGELGLSGVVGCTDPCDIGWKANDIYVIAGQSFLDDNPAAASLLESVVIPVGDISAQVNLMEDGESTQSDVERHAADWIAENRATVDEWLSAARAAA